MARITVCSPDRKISGTNSSEALTLLYSDRRQMLLESSFSASAFLL